ncbi:hypothetical protein [Chryseolinea sp. H1M3-3]|uniref:hypothetical protein n=1 Tax=Chryseolinea sp. H1M3-3 TaxID=3034144 RepID=UPI0023ED3F06|nr:hypothetical protein [Chryseolinea sp. H1M3-3]
MVSRLTLIVLTLLTLPVSAQSIDSLITSVSSVDTLTKKANEKLDSIHTSAAIRYHSLKNSYDSIVSVADDKIIRLNYQIDSLRTFNLPTTKLTHKLDSIGKFKNEKIAAVTFQVEKLRSDVYQKVNSLQLPPALSGKAGQLTSTVDMLNVSLPNTDLLTSFQNPMDFDVPTIKNPLSGQELGGLNLPNVNAPSVGVDGLANVGDQVNQVQSEIGRLPTDTDDVGKLAETQATNISAIADVEKEISQANDVPKMAGTLQDQEQLRQRVVSEVKEQAVEHFAGKQEQLNRAMESISKYKNKFPTVTSLNDLPKKRPNEMKSKPFTERIVPGVAFQLQKRNGDLLVDLNAYMAYRFTTRLSAGGGWNQRIGYSTHWNNWTSKDVRIYGPRAFSEYKVARGFSARIEVETMNSFVPSPLRRTAQDLGNREWVWGVFAGIKKEYKFMKKIKGSTMIMCRLFDPHRKSPYADVVNARFGFEFPVKKNPARKKNT